MCARAKRGEWSRNGHLATRISDSRHPSILFPTPSPAHLPKFLSLDNSPIANTPTVRKPNYFQTNTRRTTRSQASIANLLLSDFVSEHSNQVAPDSPQRGARGPAARRSLVVLTGICLQTATAHFCNLILIKHLSKWRPLRIVCRTTWASSTGRYAPAAPLRAIAVLE